MRGFLTVVERERGLLIMKADNYMLKNKMVIIFLEQFHQVQQSTLLASKVHFLVKQQHIIFQDHNNWHTLGFGTHSTVDIQ